MTPSTFFFSILLPDNVQGCCLLLKFSVFDEKTGKYNDNLRIGGCSSLNVKEKDLTAGYAKTIIV